MNLTLFLGCCWHSLQKGIKIDDTYKTYVHGSELDVFIMNGTRRYIAQVWPGATNMPDFLHPNAQKWWSKEVVEFHDLIPFDGLWLDMNEPANFCSGPNCYFSPDVKCLRIDKCCMVCNNTNLSRWDDPPYKINVLGTHEPIYTQTVAMVAEHYGGVRAYDAHNIYGTTETIATYYALKEVSIIIFPPYTKTCCWPCTIRSTPSKLTSANFFFKWSKGSPTLNNML